MTLDADATPTRGARRGRSPFELLRFTATPVPGALVVVEIEGRVAAAPGRFARRPVLVVEADAASDRPRLELAPSRSALDGDRWRATYAIPAESYDAARFALGLRGTLLDLPAPDEPTDADRLTLLAREANALRRALEAAEADAATARAEATAAAGELGAAVSAARDEARAESAERLAALEREVVEAHRVAAADAAEARTAHEAAVADLQAEHDRATAAAAERHAAALAEANARAEAAERDTAEITTVAESDLDAERRRADDAEARALAAEEGIAVLRAELAEERERLAALRRAEEADPPTTPAGSALWAASHPDPDPDPDDPDEDETRVLAPVPEEDDDTRPFTTREERTAAGERLLPLERGALPQAPARRSPGAYIAVAALILFVIALALLLGFLG